MPFILEINTIQIYFSLQEPDIASLVFNNSSYNTHLGGTASLHFCDIQTTALMPKYL
jgi:hypothetical protein